MCTSLSVFDPFQLRSICSYLPLHDLVLCRGVSRKFSAAAEQIGSCALLASAKSVFLRFPADTHRGVKFVEEPPYDELKFICANCRTVNNVTRTECVRCGVVNNDASGLRRVFVGQLRKVATTEHAEWVLAMLLPALNLYHLESHTTRSGKSKGCAWVYVFGTDAEHTVLGLNGKVFLDVDDRGREGVWFSHDRSLLLALYHERRAIAVRKATAATPKGEEVVPPPLPRMPIVCEHPVARKKPSMDSVALMGSSAPSSLPSSLDTRQLTAPRSFGERVEPEADEEEDPYERFAPRRRSPNNATGNNSSNAVRCDSLRSNSTWLSSSYGSPVPQSQSAPHSRRAFSDTPEMFYGSNRSLPDDDSSSEMSSVQRYRPGSHSTPRGPAVPVPPPNATPTRAHQEGHFAWAEANYRRMVLRAKAEEKKPEKYSHDPYGWTAIFKKQSTAK